MKISYVFPGQGSQYTGMGKVLYDTNSEAKKLFEKANEILGYNISEIMFYGVVDDLKQTKIAQPAVFLHSLINYFCMPETAKPAMVAGHSLGEFSALVAAGALSFEDALILVYKRALAMQKACELNPSTMAAVINLEDETIIKICSEIDDIVVAANFNCRGQVVISGTERGVDLASEKFKEAGAKRVIKLSVGGAFHSPLMKSAQDELTVAINKTNFKTPHCPIYQNFDAQPHCELEVIRQNLISQLVNPVKWTETVLNMISDGAEQFVEVGPGTVLKGLIVKINPNIPVENINL